MSELPFLEDALYTAARRRQRHRRRRPVVALVVVALAAAAVVARPHAGEDERVATPSPAQWSTAVQNGIEVSLPPHWFIARETLTPHLSDPREVLSVATFPLAYEPGRCNHQPDGAAADMSSRDAFITLQERRAAHLFSARPAHFAPATGRRLATCLPAMESLMFEFSESGRSFHALVYLGHQASRQTKNQVFLILDRLRVRAK